MTARPTRTQAVSSSDSVRTAAADFDRAMVELVARHRRSVLDAAANAVSASGRGGIGWIAAVTFAAARTGRGRAAPAAATVLGAFFASAALARVVCRQRPFVNSGATPAIAPPRGPSCPSDHAASAVAGAYVLSRLAPGRRVEAWTAAAVVCASRVYAGVHYPSDVLVGAALGGASGAVWERLTSGRERPSNDHAA